MQAKDIRNYTSEVPVSRSVNYIEERLAEVGARSVLKDYDNGALNGIAFIMLVDGREIPFRLPARIDRINDVLVGAIKKPRRDGSTEKRVREQATRTAWKLLADWVDVQMTLIQLDQAQVLEVFLPYVYDYKKKQTFFERLEKSHFKQLTFSDPNE